MEQYLIEYLDLLVALEGMGKSSNYLQSEELKDLKYNVNEIEIMGISESPTIAAKMQCVEVSDVSLMEMGCIGKKESSG